MGLKRIVREAMGALLRRYGYEVIDGQQVYDWQINPHTGPSYNPSALPDGAEEYLRPDNPRLVELQARYDAFDSRVTEPLVWKKGWIGPEEMLYFRGDNAYIWQLRGHNMNILSYALSWYYARTVDTLGLQDRLHEDDLFGNYVFSVGETAVSRDLLDSVLELLFLERHLGISAWERISMLDIGAGYGRFAHRAARAFPDRCNAVCTDGVAVSTFLSEYYVNFRGVGDQVDVVPLDAVEERLASWCPAIATNIHSFSECRMSAIEWWVALLAKTRVEYLMLVPNAGRHGGLELLTNDGQDFGKLIEAHGYRLMARDPKYLDPTVQSYGINPTWHYLFRLE